MVLAKNIYKKYVIEMMESQLRIWFKIGRSHDQAEIDQSWPWLVSEPQESRRSLAKNVEITLEININIGKNRLKA